jgi:hypothetical protein
VGHYGPTVRIAPATLEQLAQVREVFARLADGNDTSIALHEVLLCRLDSIEGLVLRCTAGAPSKGVVRKGHEPTRPSFDWTNPTAGWANCVDLVDALSESQVPGHQYLTWDNIGDDALVELAHRE